VPGKIKPQQSSASGRDFFNQQLNPDPSFRSVRIFLKQDNAKLTERSLIAPGADGTFLLGLF